MIRNKMRSVFIFTFLMATLLIFSNCKREKELRENKEIKGGKLEILSVTPKGSVSSKEELNRIVIIFSRPMVPLEPTPIEESSGPLLFDPPVSGKFRWMGTSVLTFIPEKSFKYSTEYRVTIPAGIKSIDGYILGTDYTWSFQTPRPKLIYHYPQNNAKWIKLNSLIFLRFNQPLDIGKAKDYIHFVEISPKGEESELSFELNHPSAEELKNESIKARPEEVIVLKPLRKMKPGHSYHVEIIKGLPGKEGTLGMLKTYKFRFKTFEEFKFYGLENNHIKPDEPIHLYFTNPVNYMELIKKIRFQPEVKIPDYYFNWDYSAVKPWIYARFKPDTDYLLIIQSDLRDEFNNELGKEVKISFSTGSYKPSVNMKTGIGIIEAYGDLRFPVSVLNTKRAEIDIAILNSDEVIPLLTNRKVFWRDEKYTGKKGFFGIYQNLIFDFPKNRRKIYAIELDKILKGNHGFLFLQLDTHSEEKWERYLKVFLQITNIGISAKFSPDSNLVWATELETGKPVSYAEIEIRNDKNKILWRGKTSENGVSITPGWKKLGIKARDRWSKPRQWVFVKKGDDIAFISSDWGTGVYPYQFGINYDWRPSPEEFLGYIFTERGIYKAGEKVNIKGIVRKKENGKLKLPDIKEIILEVKDSRGESIFNEKINLNKYGSFSLTLSLDKKAPLGFYRMEVKIPIKKGKRERKINMRNSFRVETFKPVEFKVTVHPDKEYYIFGDKYEALIAGNYLFGAPLSGQKVKWTLRKDLTFYKPPGYKDYFFGQIDWEEIESERSKLLTSGEGILDSRGTYRIKTELLQEKSRGTFRLNLEATVTDPSQKAVSGRASSILHQGEYYIGIKPSTTFIEEGKNLKIDIITVTPEGKEVSGKRIKITIKKREWHSVRKVGIGGRYRWITRKEDREIKNYEIETEEIPVNVLFTPEKTGFYIIEAKGKDSRKNEIHSLAYFYVTGKEYVAWERRDDDMIELVADKKNYKPGDTALIMVKSPYEKARALVTIEREGIIDSWLTELQSSADKIEIPVKKRYLPNVFVSVLIVQGRVSFKKEGEKEDIGKPSFKIGYIELPVSPEEKRLKIDIKTDKEEYRPGEEVEIRIKVKDVNNKGVRSEICLFVVDEGVLNLINYRTPSPFLTFYGKRPLSVETSDTRFRLIEPQSYGQKGEDVGGGGFVIDKLSLAGIELRGVFKITALWKPSIFTDNKGEASVRFMLPDNLTTFRIMVVAHIMDSCFGSGEATFKVNKPFLLRASTPRFARVGDSFEAGVVVHNYTKKKGKVLLNVEAESIKLLGNNMKTFTLGPMEAKEIRFPFKVEKIGRAILSFRAKMGKESDGLRIVIPLYLPRTTETVALFGDTTKNIKQLIKIPEEIYPGTGKIEVRISSTAMSELGESFNFLVNYPYGCLEQRVSSILPVIVGEDLIKTFKLSSKKMGELKDYVKKILEDIPQFQKSNGGFALWPDSIYDSPFITCYTLFALIKAQDKGYKVSEKIVISAQRYLIDFLHGKLKNSRYPYSKGEWFSTKAFALYVLSLRGKFETGYMEQLFNERDKLSLYGKAYLLKAINLSKIDSSMEEILLNELLNKVKVSPAKAYFQDSGEMRWIYNSNVRTTAIILQTLLETGKTYPLIPKIVRWLLEERKIGRWRSTQENFYVFYALGDYYKEYEEIPPDFKAKVYLAGKLILEEVFKGRNLAVKKTETKLSKLKRGKNLIFKINKKGKGRLFYGVRMTYAPLNPKNPRDEGIAVYKTIEPLEKRKTGKFKPGSLVLITLKIVTPQERHFVVVEDPLPAGFVAVNPSFVTESVELERKLREIRKKQSRFWWWSGFNHIEIHNDKVLLFADFLTPGIHTHSYLARAITYGDFKVPSTNAEEMYNPEIYGRTGEFKIEIKK